MRSRLASIALLIGALFTAAQPCAGWMSTPEERMACCEEGLCAPGMGHGSSGGMTQSAADQCCATSEKNSQQRHSQSPEQIVSVTAPLVQSFALTNSIPAERRRPERVTATSRSAPLHLLFSVFLV